MKNKDLIVKIKRLITSDQGTIGELYAGYFSCFTMELPWRDNRQNRSCIPKGEYNLVWCMSTHFKRDMYLVISVPGRSGVRLHSGNVAGDVSLGFKTHSLGCPLLGKYRGRLKGQEAVLYSRPTVKEFENYMMGRKAKLIIEGDV